MTEPTSTQSAEIDVLRTAYAALNRGDVPGFVRMFDSNVELIEPPEFPTGGTYRGLTAVTAHFLKARAMWAEGGCEPQRFAVLGDRVVVSTHVHVRLKDETQWREANLADVYTFSNGKVIEFRIIVDEQKALEWAGIKAADVSRRATERPSAE